MAIYLASAYLINIIIDIPLNRLLYAGENCNELVLRPTPGKITRQKSFWKSIQLCL